MYVHNYVQVLKSDQNFTVLHEIYLQMNTAQLLLMLLVVFLFFLDESRSQGYSLNN